MRKLLQLNLAKVLLIAAMVTGMNSWGQGTFGTPIFSENFGTLSNNVDLSTSNTAFSWVRVGTSTSGTPLNQIKASNPGAFTGSSALISAKGGSVSTVDKTSLSSFTSGAFSFKFKTPSSLSSAVMLSAVGAGSSFGSSSGFSGSDLSAAFQVNGTNLQIRANGAWITVQTVAANTSYEICVLFNNTAGSLSYGGSSTLPGNKCHVWINGAYVNEYNTGTYNKAATAFRIYTTTSQFEVDDIAVYNTLPTASGPSVSTNAATNITASGATLNGSANANGTGTINLNFDYGLTTSYTSAPSSISPATATGSSNTSFSGAISGLSPNTTYNFRAKAGSVDGSNATFVTLANVPGAPLVDGATVSSLNVTIDAVTQNNNPAATQYAIRENGGQYVQSGGSLGASAVWQTAAQWGTKTVTGLSANTSYSFQAKARNNAATQVETAFSSLAAGTTLPNTAPTLSATTLASFGSVCLNQSVTNSFQLLGENLTAATVTVGPLAGFTFSTTSGGTYDPSLTLNADVQGTIITDVFVKFTPTAAQIYSGNIAVAGGGASAINVAATATGVNTTPTVTTTPVTVFTGTTATMGGNVTVQGCTAVTARGIVYGTSNNPAIGGNGVIQVPSGSGTGTFSESVSGLTGSTLYYVRAYATNEGGTVYGSSVSFTTQCTTPVNATSFNPTAGNTQVALSWANGSCSDEVIVVAKASSAVTATPSGDGTGYSANEAFATSGTAIATDEYIVYKGTGTSVTVTGLTNGTTYHFKVFTRRGSSWSSGVTTSAVPALVYCTPTYNSTGGCSAADRINGFVLNGISNLDSSCGGAGAASYINYPSTSFTTTLFRGLSYQAQITNGTDTGNIAVWIDFNNDGTFDTSERFSNTLLVTANQTITLNIPIPANAAIGTHRLRVREVYSASNVIALDPCANYAYGEVEDYTITITDNVYPVVTTAAVTAPTSTTATVGGNVTSDSGSAVTARGVVYALTANPAINGTGVTRVDIGSGTGSFSTTINGLQDSSTYYVRAFAINANGTSYGLQQTFTTTSLSAPVAIPAGFLTAAGTGFVAKWEPVTGATGYKLDVSTLSTFATEQAANASEGFELVPAPGGYLNGGYTLENGLVWTLQECIRANSPQSGSRSLQLNGNLPSSVTSPSFNKISSVTFFARGSGGTISVRKIVNGVTTTLANQSLSSTFQAQPYTVTVNETGSDVKIMFVNTSGSTIYIDNVVINYTSVTPSYVGVYDNLSVGNVTKYDVTGAGITAGTTYYYRVKAIGHNGTNTSAPSDPITAIAKSEKVWNGTNWVLDNVVTTPPTTLDKAVIEGNYNTGAPGQGELTVGQLVVNSGTFTIAEGDNVTVTNDVSMTNSTHIIAAGEEQTYGGEVGEKVIVGPKMVIEHNANLIQVNDVNNTGNAQVYKQSAPMFRLDYAMWSSPVAGETLIGFSSETLANRFYTYRSTTNTYTNSNTNNGDIAFEEGVGYLIRTANNMQDYVAPGAGQPEPTGVRWEGDFIGTLNNGNVDVAVTPAGTGGSTGFNAVGNPYPSPINVHAFYDGNTASIDPLSTLFFWRKKNGSETESYAKLTKLAYSANSDNGVWGDSSMGAFLGASNTWVINPGQGFIVQATGSTIHFNNTMRRAVNNNQQFRNAQDETAEASRLWLNLKGAQGEFSQAVIGYTDVTTLGADYGWDGRAFMSDKSVIYSYMGEEKLGIQARPSFDASDVVPMGVKVETAGTYTISLDHVDGVFAADQDIFLRDNVLGVTHDLKQGAYEFALEAGLIAGRFDVVYAEALGNENPVWNANSVIIYKEGSAIKINSGNEEITAVSVYDMRGRLLYSGSDINATETAVNGLQAEKQVLIVNVSTQKGEVSKKIVF